MTAGPKVRVAKLSEFRPQQKNANKHTPRGLGMLDAAMSSDGYVAPVTAAADGEVIDGSARLEVAADRFGVNSEVLVIEHDGTRPIVAVREDVPDASVPLARHISLSANRIAQVDLDFDAELILEDIAGGLDLSGLWSDVELSTLLQDVNGGEPQDAEPQVDRAAELQEKWQTATGQLWCIGEHRLLCGDSTKREDVERVMGGEKADLGVTSPPYAVGKEYEKDVGFDEHLALLRGIADRAIEIIRPGGFFFVNFDEIAAQSHTKPLTGSNRQCLYPISKDYWQIFHVERGMDLYAQRIWYKPFNRLQQPFWTYHTSIPHYQEWEHIWTWRLPGGNGDTCYDWGISSRAVWDTRDESTDDGPLTRHTAAFPVCLPGRAIKAHSAKGATIWDPFSGSGTTIVVCENLGRRGRGIEISPTYVAVALERMVTAFPSLPIERIEP